MKKVISAVALSILCAGVASAQLPIRTVANLPTALCTSGELENKVYVVSDGNAAGDCSTGTGTTAVVCVCDGGSFVAGSLPSANGISADGNVLIEATGTTHSVTATATAGIALSPTTTLIVDAAGSTDELTVAAGVVTVAGKYVNTPQAVTCADSGDGSASAATITPASNVILVTNSDADGCDVTMSETGAVSGTVIRITVVSNAGTTVNFADTSGVSEIGGAFAAAVWDSISMVYATSTWAELSRSNN